MAKVVSRLEVSGLGVWELAARTRRVMVSTAAIAAVVFASPAFAQDKPAAAPKAAAKPAAAAKAAPADKAAGDDKTAGKTGGWVKLCEKFPIAKKDKDGKETKEDKELCMTSAERLDGNTGLVIVSAALREIEGKQRVMVMVPLGMAIPPGIRAAVYTKEQWEKAAKKEKIEESALKWMDLKFSLCHAAGCTAEYPATPELIEQMKTGGGLMAVAVNAGGQPIGFPVPLDGFSQAFGGAPMDNKAYAEARGQMMKQIRERQAQLLEKYKKEVGKLPPQPGATGSTSVPDPKPAAKAADKPAEKK